MLVFAVRVRVLPTSFRSNLIYAAVIFVIKKSTWQYIQHVVIVLINMKVFIYKLSRFHVQVSGNSVNISGGNTSRTPTPVLANEANSVTNAKPTQVLAIDNDSVTSAKPTQVLANTAGGVAIRDPS